MKQVQQLQAQKLGGNKNQSNPMREILLDRVILNITVGTDEAKLLKAMKLLELLSGEKPVKCLARKRIATWKIRPGLPIGCKVTLRGEKALAMLKRTLESVDNKLNSKQFKNGAFTFGIKEYIQISDFQYQRDIGIIGFDVACVFKRRGFRVKEKKIKRGNIPNRHKISETEIINYVQKNLNVKFD